MSEGTGTSRRQFLQRTAGLAGAGLGAGLVPGLAARDTATAASAPPASLERALMFLDGTRVGLLKSLEGGEVRGEVVTATSVTPGAPKHIGNVKYEPFEAGFDFTHRALFLWINALWQGDFQTKAVDFSMVNLSGAEVARSSLSSASPGDLTVPELDAGSTDPGVFRLELHPVETRHSYAPGGTQSLSTTAKQWLRSGFRLELSGLDTTKVSKIDSFTVRHTPLGGTKPSLGTVGFPTLRVTLPASAAATWRAWFDDFVVRGNNGQTTERSGRITFLAPDLITRRGVLELSNVGIYGLSPRPVMVGGVKRVIADLYVERMRFVVGR